MKHMSVGVYSIG